MKFSEHNWVSLASFYKLAKVTPPDPTLLREPIKMAAHFKEQGFSVLVLRCQQSEYLGAVRHAIENAWSATEPWTTLRPTLETNMLVFCNAVDAVNLRLRLKVRCENI